MSFLLTDKEMTNTSSLFWKSKHIERVCHSSKDAMSLNISKMIDDTVFAVTYVQDRLPVNLYMDSESMFKSIASSKQVEQKSLRMTVQDMKDRL